MTKFAKTLTAMAAMAALTVFAAPMADAMPMKPKPVAASFHNDHIDARASAKLDTRIAGLRSDITSAQRFHKLNGRDANKLTTKLNAIASEKRMDARNGLTNREVTSLNASLDNLSAQLRMPGHR